MQTKLKLSILLLILMKGSTVLAQQPATVKEYAQNFPTYPFSDPSPVPLLTPVYPYFRYDGFTDKPVQRSWKVVELENDYIKLLILPEIGGKIWAAIEKKTNRPFLYYNHAVKFRDIAMRGPWTSGGLEANYGIMGHTPNCATPVDYVTRKNADGSVSCTIGALDLLTRSNWRMEIHLPKDKAYFTTQSFWYNATPVEQPYYHWMNAGLKAAGKLEFIYPGTKYLGHDGEHASWPVNATNGKRINFYDNNDFGGYKSYHVFGKHTNFSGAYWHDDKMGMVRYGTRDGKAGTKVWIWGLSRQGMIWEKLLTDTDGQYVELQSGRLFNQNGEKSSFTPFKHRSLAPNVTDTWKEYWYPVGNTQGFVQANEYGALNLTYENGWLKLFFSPVQAIRDTLEVKEGTKVLYSKAIQLAPLQIYADSVKVSANGAQLTATLGRFKMLYESDPQEGVLSRPVETPKDFDYTSAYGLYLLGKEAMDEKRYPQAETALRASLQKDHNFTPALVKLAALLYRNMRYTDALELIKRALSIDTHAGDANYYYGLINAQLQQRTDAKDGFELATLSAEYRGAAYAQLSKLYLQEGNTDRALQYAQQAVAHSELNMDALQMQALLYRIVNDQRNAEEVLNRILLLDPLNHFAWFEKYLWQGNAAAKQQFTGNIRNELPAETYLELGVWYYNAGRLEEAEKVFALCPPAVEANYWLSFLRHSPVDLSAANPAGSFPFRTETAQVLEQLRKQQQHWLLNYHLALIYHDRNRLAESKQLLAESGQAPDFAPFYVVRAALNKEENPELALADYQRAVKLDPQWRYSKLLTEYYNSRQQYEQALPVVETFYRTHPDHYIMGMLYARTLLLNKKYAAADAVLTKLNIIPFEGATDGRELYRETKLMQAVQTLQKKDYKKAQAFINSAQQWPENLGVGKPYDQDIDTRLEDYMSYLCLQATGKKQEAAARVQKILQFTPRIDNTVRNFQPANTYVTAWAYQQTQQQDKAKNWLNEQAKQFPDNRIVLWGKAQFEKSGAVSLTAQEKDANVRIIEVLQSAFQ